MLLAGSGGSGGLMVGLGAAVSATVLIASVVKVGRWVGSVGQRLDRHDRDLRRLGAAVASRPDDLADDSSATTSALTKETL